jgi:predicted Zn-dependent peptidase
VTLKLTTLPSGLRVVSFAMPHVETASLAVVIGAGSRDEREGEHGLAHFLEHMAFKGTKRRNPLAIAADIERVGGDLNAATSVEQTAYTVRLLREDVDLGLDVISDILGHSLFDPAEIRREKTVVLQEIAGVDDDPDDLVYDRFTERAFHGQAVGLPILGTAKTVRSLSREKLTGFLEREYRTGRMIVAAAGAVEHDQVVEVAARQFSVFPQGGTDTVVRPNAVYTGGETRAGRRLEQAHVILGFKAPSHHDPDYYAAQIFTSIVGGGMASRLFQEVRETRGLAYSIYAFLWGYSDCGVFGVSYGASEKHAKAAMDVSIETLQKAACSVTEEEVSRAKAQLKVSLMMALESSSARAEQMARHLLAFDRVIPPAEIVARVEAITAADICRVGSKMLASAPTLSALGPSRGLPDLAAVQTRLAHTAL